MVKKWQLQKAKSKFSELVSNAEMGDVQIVTKGGKDCVAIIPIEEYRRFFQKKDSLLDFLKSMPKVELNIERDSK